MFFTPPYIGGVFFVYPICCHPLTVHRSVLTAIHWLRSVLMAIQLAALCFLCYPSGSAPSLVLPSVLRAIQMAALRFLIASEWLCFINIGFAPSLWQSNWLPFVSFVIRVAPLLSHWLPSVLRAIQLAAQRFFWLSNFWLVNRASLRPRLSLRFLWQSNGHLQTKY